MNQSTVYYRVRRVNAGPVETHDNELPRVYSRRLYVTQFNGNVTELVLLGETPEALLLDSETRPLELRADRQVRAPAGAETVAELMHESLSQL